MNNNQEQQYLECYTFSKNQQNQQKRKFSILKFIAGGTEGQVFLAKPIDWCFNVDQVAIKIQQVQKNEIIEFYEKLKEQQNKLDQKGSNEKSQIIKIYELCQNINQELVIIMEVGGQDLFNFEQQNNQLDFLRKEQICLQLVLAIKQLHQLQYIHRDIKPENFVIVNQEFKLIDFGLTKSINEREMTMNVGSRIFQAPEIIVGDGHYTASVDIWSLGCTFYEVFANQPLLKVNTLYQAQVLICNHVKDQQLIYNSIAELSISQAWKDLIKSMLNPQPDQRIAPEEVVLKIKSFLKNQDQPIFNNRLITPLKNPQYLNGVPHQINGIPQKMNGVQQQTNVIPQQSNGAPKEFVNQIIHIPNQSLNLNLINKQLENQQHPNIKQFNNVIPIDQKQQPVKFQPQQNNQPIINEKTFCLMTQQEQPQQKDFLQINQNKIQTQKIDQQINFNKDQKIKELEQVNQDLKQQVQRLQTELQEARNEINEFNNLTQLLDQNDAMKSLLKKQKQQQQEFLEEINKFLN